MTTDLQSSAKEMQLSKSRVSFDEECTLGITRLILWSALWAKYCISLAKQMHFQE